MMKSRRNYDFINNLTTCLRRRTFVSGKETLTDASPIFGIYNFFIFYRIFAPTYGNWSADHFCIVFTSTASILFDELDNKIKEKAKEPIKAVHYKYPVD